MHVHSKPPDENRQISFRNLTHIFSVEAELKLMDLHLHSTYSDGTDSPEELLVRVREAGIPLFAVTDHDAAKAYEVIRQIRKPMDPYMISGIEFSCRDELGHYHILGYGFDPNNQSMLDVIEQAHRLRMKKVIARLDFLESEFGFTFPEEEVKLLLTLNNPGKPHIGNLMVKYGYAETKEQAIADYINKVHFRSEYVPPEEAIQGIVSGGGIPVLAHPPFGSGEQLILGDEMEERLRRLISFGLLGVEAFYSGFTPKLRAETLSNAEKYNLYVTAGSDYHGKNKLVRLGNTGLRLMDSVPDGMIRFLEDILFRQKHL